MRKIPQLSSFLGCAELLFDPGVTQMGEVDVILTWGNKATGARAAGQAEKYQKPLWRIEDGFLRSVYPGAEHAPLSLVVDPQGIYYDASKPSRLELLLLDSASMQNEQLLRRAAQLKQRLLQTGVSKYNNAAPSGRSQLAHARLLLIDQTENDASIAGALASEQTFQQMLDEALAQYPAQDIAIKVHPEVSSGRKRGYLTRLAAQHPGLQWWREPMAPAQLFEQVEQVFTVSSQLGFEALLAGVPVSCFGAPFYAGWGLTSDRVTVERRVVQRSIEQLVAAAYLLYPVYRNPITQQNCEAEEIIELLALQRSSFANNAGRTLVAGFSKWKRPAARAFLGGPGSSLEFLEDDAALPADAARVVVWGQRGRAHWAAQTAARQLPLHTIEDGFLRSLELGSDLSLPLSLSLDEAGIYYDPTRPSQLEQLLNQAPYGPGERQRAASLRQTIIEQRLTKYAVQADRPLQLDRTGQPSANQPSANQPSANQPSADQQTQTRILVVGQVEDDASVQLGSPRVRSNAELLAAVRAEYPRAYLLYKPHPDVLSGNRRGELSTEATQLADHIETEASVLACLDACDSVATMTSLVGFEALVRGKPVHCYGLPFYAGWGLTTDALPCPRRTRQLTVDDLVYAALIAYPRYYNYEHGYFITPEMAVAYLSHGMARSREQGSAATSIAPSLKRRLRRLTRYVKGLLRER